MSYWDAVWLTMVGVIFCAVVFVLGWFYHFEKKAILSQERGDTFTEKTREWLKTETPGGGVRFLVLWFFVLMFNVALFVVWLWFAGHILKLWH